MITISTGFLRDSFTAPDNGYFFVLSDNADNSGLKIYINGLLVSKNEAWTPGNQYIEKLPVAKGDVISFGGWPYNLPNSDVSRGVIPYLRFFYLK